MPKDAGIVKGLGKVFFAIAIALVADRAFPLAANKSPAGFNASGAFILVES